MKSLTLTLTLTLTLAPLIPVTPMPSPNPRSFVLAYRIMKLIITEQGNNAWLAHGTPHLNVRSDYIDTATGIKPKDTFGACNM